MAKIRILNTQIDKLSADEAIENIDKMIVKGGSSYIVTANAEICYMAYKDSKMQEVVNGASMVTADGSGILWAAKKLGDEMPERVTGIDLVYRICQESAKRGWRIYLVGSAGDIAKSAGERLKLKYIGCNIVGAHNGFVKDKDVENALIEDIMAKKPHILLVGMGAPRQEYWIVKNQARMGVPVAMGVGGSFDVISGTLKRAPMWVQKLSLEWLYRAIMQPSRFKRIVNLPKFMLAVLRNR